MNWYLIIGMLVYTIVGLIMANVTYNYIKELELKVGAIDGRYCERLWYRVKIRYTGFNKFMVDLGFMIFWPAICIAAIMKAEKEYDIIVRHSAFREVP